MSSSKLVLLIILTVLGLGFIWSYLSPESDKIDSQVIPQNSSAQSYTDLLNRIQSLESEWLEQQTLHQQQELRISELEQKLTASMLNPAANSVIDPPPGTGRIFLKLY